MTWQRIKLLLFSATGRLAASYLAVIMGMSLGYSVVLYTASVRELQRQLPPAALFEDIEDRRVPSPVLDGFDSQPGLSEFLNRRIDEARQTLLMRLLLLNVITLVLGAGLSYYLARRSLQPIEANMEAQSQFVSDASHELRTPLTTLLTSNEVALRDKGLTLGQAKQLLRQNVEEAGKLQELTAALLKLAKQEEGELLVEPVSLQDVVSDAINRIVAPAQAKHMTIEDRSRPQMVMADRNNLAQAVIVLLDNAIKYSPPKSTIIIEAGKMPKHSRQAFIRVSDQGPGIRPYDLRRIFDRFYRADQSRSTQAVAGNGVGLALAKKIVEQHNGQIKAASSVGKGSVFTIVLPV